MFISQKTLFINIDALSQRYIISSPPPPAIFSKGYLWTTKGISNCGTIFFPALLQMVNTKNEIFPLMEELFSAKYPIFSGYQLVHPLAIFNTVLAGQGTADPFQVVLHFSGSFSSSKDYREAHNHERLLMLKLQLFAENCGLCCLRSIWCPRDPTWKSSPFLLPEGYLLCSLKISSSRCWQVTSRSKYSGSISRTANAKM